MRRLGALALAWLATSGLVACGGSADAEAEPNADAGADSVVADDTGTSGDDTGADAPEPSKTCPPGGAMADKSSLVFDGVDDYVTMGAAPTLGLDKFTVEAWVYRDGAGVAASTGVGGLSIVPIAGKGRGEGDGSNVDCNYAFGFAGNVLAADFEDTADGGNHPVQGKIAIAQKEWHHVAATYDGTTWRLYVDGKLDVQLAANAAPRRDSIQHFALGTTLDSKGVAAGFFKGKLDEVRVWGRARTAAELTEGMYRRLTTGDGLVSRWALDGKDMGAPDTLGKNAGTLTGGPMFDADGAVLDLGQAPAFTTLAPAAGAVVTGTSAVLKASVVDPDSDQFIAKFHLRDLGPQDDFTIVVLPDTQYYTSRPGDRYFDDQTDWIMKNRAAYNIVGVIHNGDIVDSGSNNAQWTIADAAMKLLEVKSADLPDGMPYGTCAGNHDQSPGNTVGATTQYNKWFGPARFAGRKYFGGTFAPGKADENWVQFDAGGFEIVVVNLQFSTRAREAPVLEWTRKVFADHPKALGIVNSHHILGATGEFSTVGSSIYEGVKAVDNVQLLTCGHVGGESRRTDTAGGNVIHSMLADYQFRERGGGSSLRLWEFSPPNNELTVRTYSPADKAFETDANSEFTLKVDLTKPAGPFNDVATVDPAPATDITTNVDALVPGHTYEWYVTVDDCVHVEKSPARRFKIAK